MKVLGQDVVFDRIEHKRNVGCVCGTRGMHINLFLGLSILFEESRTHIFQGLFKCCAFIIWEIFVQRNLCNFLLEKILLVQEEDHGRPHKEAGVADFLEQREGLLQAIGGGILIQPLVIFRNGCHKEHGIDIVEAVDPLSAFVPLATNIKEAELSLLDLEGHLHNTRGLDTGPKDVVICRDIVRFGYPLQVLLRKEVVWESFKWNLLRFS